MDVGEVKDLGVSVYVPFAEDALGKGETKDLAADLEVSFANIALGRWETKELAGAAAKERQRARVWGVPKWHKSSVPSA